MIKDYSKKECCLTCKSFCWWDGDYCCIANMDIHQYGNGNKFMNVDIDNTMETSETCKDYEKTNHPKLNEFINEYKKFKEWDRLVNNLEAHVKY